MKKHTKQYYDIVLKEMEQRLDIKNLDKNKELGEVAYNRLFNIDGPKYTRKQMKRKANFFYAKLFIPFFEISDSIETIKIISNFIGEILPSSDRISRIKYLKYHTENYLNEIYLLWNRLTAYLKTVQRAYKKANNYSEIKEVFKSLDRYVTQTFREYVKLRGSHVHQKRHYNEAITRLNLIELLSYGESEQAKLLREYFDQEYQKTAENQKKVFDEDILNIEEILDYYFKHILQVIGADGGLSYPPNIRET